MPPVHQSLIPWLPWLHGNEAQPALSCLHDITSTLESALEHEFKNLPEGNMHGSYHRTYHLAEGAAGVAVFFAYMEAAGLATRAREFALEYLSIAIESLATQAMSPPLYSGFTGIAWAVQHVSGVLKEPVDDLSAIDSAVETYLGHSPWKDEYDLISGLVGLGVYCLERPESETARRSLELIVSRLDELSVSADGGITWYTAPEMLPQQQRERFPQGYYNLGVAHGVPGVIALLARCHAAGISPAKTRAMLEGTVRWFLQQRLPAGQNSCFPTFHIPGQPPDDCRLAWCYGDAGIAATLLIAARCMGNSSWEQTALEIARHSARRDPQTCGVQDVCFCHGSAGLAHIFNRFYQATHEDIFATAARYWLQRSLQFQQPGTGAAGFTVITADEQMNVIVAGRFGIIEGIAGVGLMLLAALSAIEPSWDRIFLVDVPPQPVQR
jgi:lantibiotic modifying enzyme